MPKRPDQHGTVAVTIKPANRGHWWVTSVDSDGYHSEQAHVPTWMVRLTTWQQRRTLLANQRWRDRSEETLEW